MQYFDSHLHLTDNEYSNYLSHIIFSLRCLKITTCSVTVNLATSKKSLALFNPHRDIINQFIGIHPEFAMKENIADFKRFFENNLDFIDGIGEIGLDPTYANQDEKQYSIQKKTFHVLLELAEKYNKPISIHSRKSLDDILQILTAYKIKSSLLHWFDGSKKQLKRAMDMGIFVSYGPVLLYSPDKKVLLKKTNIDKILVETDGPVRYSNCFNFLPSSSISHLFSVIKCMGDILNLDFGSISELLKNNSEQYLMKSKNANI
jgi:TatD DNase family protein